LKSHRSAKLLDPNRMCERTLDKRMKLLMIFCQTQNVFSIYVGEEMFCTEHSGLRYFIIVCNLDKYEGWGETRVKVSYIMYRLE